MTKTVVVCLAVVIRMQEMSGSNLQTLTKTPVLGFSHCLQATAEIVYEFDVQTCIVINSYNKTN